MKTRRVISLLLVLGILFSFTACTQGEGAEAPTEADQSEETNGDAVEAPTEADQSEEANDDAAEPIRIGYLHLGYTGSLMIEANRLIDYAGEALGVEVVYGGSFSDAESVIRNAENLVAAGVDGLIVCNFTEQSLVSIAKTCEENGVYFAQYYRTLTNPEVITELEGNEYYVGRTFESEYDVAYNLGMQLVNAGSKNVALLSYNHGDTTAETRYKGYTDVFNENGVAIVAEEWDVEDAAVSATNLLAAYPEIDGWALITSYYAPGVKVALENAGKGKMPIVGVDFYDSMGQDMEDGYLLAIGGGHHASPLFSFLMVYNAINGAYDPTGFPFDVQDNILVLKNYEDYQNYMKWYVGDVLPFTAEEIKALTITYNPEHTISDLQEAAAALTLEDVMSRHESLIN